MLNRVIYGGKVYYKVADLAILFDVSPYKMRKAIHDQKIKTKLLKGFGRCVFVLEENVATINVYGTVKVLETKPELVTANPVKETKIVECSKAKRKSNKGKKSATKKKQSVVKDVKKELKNEENTAQVAPIEVHKDEHATILERIKKKRLQYVQDGRGGIYNDIYMTHIGDEISLEETTSEHNETLKTVAEMLELEFDETYIQAICF